MSSIIAVQTYQANKWSNQRIKKKFNKRSWNSRAKKASDQRVKGVPDQMVRGWIRGKASRNGKLGKELQRAFASLREMESQSVHDYELSVYGDGEDDYDEHWWRNVNEPWLRQQRRQNSFQEAQRERVRILQQEQKKKEEEEKKAAVAAAKAAAQAKAKAAAQAKAKAAAQAKAAAAAEARRKQKQLLKDVEYKRSKEEEAEHAALSEQYSSAMSSLEDLGSYSAIEGLAERSSYKQHAKEASSGENMAGLKKIMKEIRKDLPRNICTAMNGAMFVRFDENNPRFLQALLGGLEGTPYEHGLFLFDLYLGSEYPQKPLSIKHITKGASLVPASHSPGGFSPNLHRGSGKVCLSLLGTWSGPGWEAGKSNTYQVLSSILFMIFGAEHPYYMEPSYGGWEGTVDGRKEHEAKVIRYDEEIMFHSVKYAMLETLRSPYAGFEEVITTHFRLKRNAIATTIKWWLRHPNYSQAFKDRLKPVFDQLLQAMNKL